MTTIIDLTKQFAGQAAELTKQFAGQAAEVTEQYTGKAAEITKQYAEQAVVWAKEDLSKDGKWKYQVVIAPSIDALQESLNKLGSEGWECEGPKELEGNFVLTCKKAQSSSIMNAMGVLGGLIRK